VNERDEKKSATHNVDNINASFSSSLTATFSLTGRLGLRLGHIFLIIVPPLRARFLFIIPHRGRSQSL
jgi:hypothetical protein